MRRRGVTLLEVLAALAIMVVVLGLVATNYQGLARKSQPAALASAAASNAKTLTTFGGLKVGNIFAW